MRHLIKAGKKNTAKLVRKRITNKLGKQQTVLVKPDADSKKGKRVSKDGRIITYLERMIKVDGDKNRVMMYGVRAHLLIDYIKGSLNKRFNKYPSEIQKLKSAHERMRKLSPKSLVYAEVDWPSFDKKMTEKYGKPLWKMQLKQYIKALKGTEYKDSMGRPVTWGSGGTAQIDSEMRNAKYYHKAVVKTAIADGLKVTQAVKNSNEMIKGDNTMKHMIPADLMEKGGRAGLTRKVITNVRGNQQTVYVRMGEKEKAKREKKIDEKLEGQKPKVSNYIAVQMGKIGLSGVSTVNVKVHGGENSKWVSFNTKNSRSIINHLQTQMKGKHSIDTKVKFTATGRETNWINASDLPSLVNYLEEHHKKVNKPTKGTMVARAKDLKILKPIKDAMKTKTATKVRQDKGGALVVQYHQTDVVRVKGNVVTLNSGGYKTKTTKERMNLALSMLGNRSVGVYQKKGEWYVTTAGGTLPFKDGMKINLESGGKAKGGAGPKPRVRDSSRGTKDEEYAKAKAKGEGKKKK